MDHFWDIDFQTNIECGTNTHCSSSHFSLTLNYMYFLKRLYGHAYTQYILHVDFNTGKTGTWTFLDMDRTIMCIEKVYAGSCSEGHCIKWDGDIKRKPGVRCSIKQNHLAD